MSHLTQCNYCSLRQIRSRAKENGNTVCMTRNVAWTSGGINVYVVPPNVHAPKVIVEDSDFHKKYFVSWFMALTSCCAC